MKRMAKQAPTARLRPREVRLMQALMVSLQKQEQQGRRLAPRGPKDLVNQKRHPSQKLRVVGLVQVKRMAKQAPTARLRPREVELVQVPMMMVEPAPTVPRPTGSGSMIHKNLDLERGALALKSKSMG